jgi:precorrin-6B methylase 1
VSANTVYSTGALVGDCVIRSIANKVIIQSGSNSPGLVVDSSNDVGIGTTNPGYKLEVNSNLMVGANVGTTGVGLTDREVKFQGSGFTHYSIWNSNNMLSINNTSASAGFGSYGTPIISCLQNGNVGIGTSNPVYGLQINTGGSNTNAVTCIENPTNAATNFGAQLLLANTTPGGGRAFLGAISALRQNNAADYNSYLAFSIGFNTALVEVMRLNPLGYMGIGTSNPITLLDVNMSSTVAGVSNIIARFTPSSNVGFDAGVIIGSVGSNSPYIGATGSNYSLSFTTSNTTRMSIAPSGTVTISGAAVIATLSNTTLNTSNVIVNTSLTGPLATITTLSNNTLATSNVTVVTNLTAPLATITTLSNNTLATSNVTVATNLTAPSATITTLSNNTLATSNVTVITNLTAPQATITSNLTASNISASNVISMTITTSNISACNISISGISTSNVTASNISASNMNSMLSRLM